MFYQYPLDPLFPWHSRSKPFSVVTVGHNLVITIMSPNLGVPANENVTPNGDIPIILTNISDPDSLSEEGFIEQEQDIDVVLLPEGSTHIPLEQNPRELLMRSTDIEDLTTVTQVKLRVISREITLQYLNIYAPALRELILDGSVIASLRDFGDGLRNLKILRVNRCGLVCIDGVFGFENLEELHAADNTISNLAPCVFLANLKILDVRRNFLDGRNITYLKLCTKLSELYVEGNPRMEILATTSEMVGAILPQLKKLDGYSLILTGRESAIRSDDAIDTSNSYVYSFSRRNEREFSIQFPPRVFHN